MEPFQNTGQPDWDWWGRLWPTPGETLRRLGVTPGDTLVEVGSGNGYFALPAAKITDPEPVYAVDIEASHLAELEHLAEEQGIENVVPVHGDARSLAETLPGEVDAVLVANTFHGIEDPKRFVAEAVDVLSPDGRLIVVNWHQRAREETTVLDEPRGPPTRLRLSPPETESLVESATAFSERWRVELPPYHYGLCFER